LLIAYKDNFFILIFKCFSRKVTKIIYTYINIHEKPHNREALCSSVVKDFFTTGMVENVGYALWAVACSPTNQAINIALTDGVV
jgi:hypothetical protein